MLLMVFGLVFAPLPHHRGADGPAGVEHGAGSVERLDARGRTASFHARANTATTQVVTRADRRDLGWLGLMLLLFGLVLAPLLHRHEHGHAHHHGADGPAGAEHGAGSVEHLDAIVQLSARVAAPHFVPVETEVAPVRAPEPPVLVARVTVAQPQGP